MKNQAMTVTCGVRPGAGEEVSDDDAEAIKKKISEAIPGAAVDVKILPPHDDGDEDLVMGLHKDLLRSVRRAAASPGISQSVDDWISTACRLRLQRDKNMIAKSTDLEDLEEEWEDRDDRRRGGRRGEE